jgi:hypothetical protein
MTLPNHAYQNVSYFNAYGQPEADSFGYETPPQFPFRPQPIDMTSARAMAKPGADPNNLTIQLATILRESFGIEPKDRGHVRGGRQTRQFDFPNWVIRFLQLQAKRSPRVLLHPGWLQHLVGVLQASHPSRGGGSSV